MIIQISTGYAQVLKNLQIGASAFVERENKSSGYNYSNFIRGHQLFIDYRIKNKFKIKATNKITYRSYNVKFNEMDSVIHIEIFKHQLKSFYAEIGYVKKTRNAFYSLSVGYKINYQNKFIPSFFNGAGRYYQSESIIRAQNGRPIVVYNSLQFGFSAAIPNKKNNRFYNFEIQKAIAINPTEFQHNENITIWSYSTTTLSLGVSFRIKS